MLTTLKTTDPAAVATSILEQAERAWNLGDGASYGALFTDDSDFVNVRGEHHRGSAAIGHGHQAIFDSIYAGSTVRYRVDAARLLSPGLVLAVASATLDAPHGPLQGINHSRITMVIAQQDEDWRVTAFHNTLVAA